MKLKGTRINMPAGQRVFLHDPSTAEAETMTLDEVLDAVEEADAAQIEAQTDAAYGYSTDS